MTNTSRPMAYLTNLREVIIITRGTEPVTISPLCSFAFSIVPQQVSSPKFLRRNKELTMGELQLQYAK